jgi:hypothetical protein
MAAYRVLSPPVRRWIAELIEQHGIRTVAKLLDLSVTTVARIHGGLPVSGGTESSVLMKHEERRAA